MNLLSEVDITINHNQLIEPGNHIVVAVSGGPDSVALLHILNSMKEQYGWHLVVAHVNHGFRGDESDQEANFVKELAASLDLPCEVGVFDVPAYIEQSMLNSQVAAREKRYEFLHEVASKYKADRIALAHHADDQAETILMRLLRGTGPSGLSGILPKRKDKNVELIRPLLRIKKEMLIAYCHEHQIQYCNDSSNLLRKYFRNEIRLEIMPYLQQFNEQLPDALSRLSEMMRAEDEHMEQETTQAMEELVTSKKDEYHLTRSRFIRLSIALQRRVIKLILNYLVSQDKPLDYTKLENIREMIVREFPTTQIIPLFRDVHIIREYNQVSFVKALSGNESFCYQIDHPEDMPDIRIGNDVLTFCLLDIQNEQGKEGMLESSPRRTSNTEAWFDLDEVQFPLIIRNRMDGDRIEPFGLNGSKKVKNMFIDAKVTPRQRNCIPLLVDFSQRVLWVAGFRQSKHATVRPGMTKRVLQVKLESEV